MTDKTYEMLWDCEYCGTKKLLGKTHRHCPSCGGPQNPETRYFPEDDEKVAVEDHVYAGADLACPACDFPNSRAAKHCGRCGSPLEEGAEVKRRDDVVGAYAGEADGAGEAPAGMGDPGVPAEPSRPRSRTPLFLGLGVAVLAIGGLLFGLLSTHEAVFQVAGHAWTREVEIERLERVKASGWCDSLPAAAEVVSRSREVRSHEKVPDGEDCRTRKVDNGDGTFREKRECKPKYRKEPVYDQKCTWYENRWQRARTLEAAGGSLDETPEWPEVRLAGDDGRLGSEREGTRRARYTVRFVDGASGEEATCDLDEGRWRGFAPKSEWKGEVARIGGLRCDSLTPL